MECVRCPKVLQGVAQKLIFSFLNKIQFQSNKTFYKVTLCETFGGKFVEQSISYEMTEKYNTESVTFHVKCWLKLTYPVVASTCMLARHTLSPQLKNDAMSKRVRTTAQ